MILRKLKMKNFRQFQGIQEIVFSPQVDSDKKNITVIFGDNGLGKTGIFRAIVFCLYGDHYLSQDAHITEKELHLVNIAELQKFSGSGKRKPVETLVELEFSHKGSDYNLKRTIHGMLDEGETIEERGPVCIIQKTHDGNTKTIEDISEITRTINSILDKRVREYFLFDGEKIERLTRASSEQRKEISRGLRNLLKIDTLEMAVKATGRLQKNLDAQLEKKSRGDYARILHKIGENSNRRSWLEERLQDLDRELELATEEKRKVDKEFDRIKEIKDFLKKRSDLEDREKELEEQRNGLLSEIKTRTGKVSLLLMTDTIKNVFNYIDQRKQKGEIPSEIRKDLIDRILSEGRCICGREVVSDSNAFDNIIQWKNRTSEVIIEDFMLELWRLLSGVKSHFYDIAEITETLLQRYGITKSDIEKVRIEIKEVNEKIGSSEREDASKLQKIRQNTEEKIKKLEAERIVDLDELNELEDEYEKLQVQRKEKEREEGIKNELSQRAALSSEANAALCAVHKEFTKEIKRLIGESATEYFRQFIDKQGFEMLRKIIVNDDYSIQILDRWGKPFLADISAGQRQIMSISFIAALAKSAAKEMPFFMDSPFGKLSNEHRKNLITNIPKFASQWILLATDTEFRRQEARLFQKTALWGRFYILKGKGAGVTRIESCGPDEAFSYLKDYEGEL